MDFEATRKRLEERMHAQASAILRDARDAGRRKSHYLAPAHSEMVDQLSNEGLLKFERTTKGGSRMYSVTKEGRKYLRALGL